MEGGNERGREKIKKEKEGGWEEGGRKGKVEEGGREEGKRVWKVGKGGNR